MEKAKKVLMVFTQLPDYRERFLINLYNILNEKGIKFEVVSGNPFRKNEYLAVSELPFVKKVKSLYIPFGGKYIVIEKFFKYMFNHKIQNNWKNL